MIEDVVAKFMAEHGEDAASRFLGDAGVPDDDAFCGADAGDVGVGVDGLVAGEHPEHAVGRNWHAAANGDALELRNQVRRFGGERLKFAEHGIDDQRLNEEDEECDWNENEPEIKPPALRTLADDQKKEPGEKAADNDG